MVGLTLTVLALMWLVLLVYAVLRVFAGDDL